MNIDRIELGKPATACTYTLSPTSRTHTAAAETGSVSVTASNSACAWNAASNSSWASLTSGASGTGNGTVAYSVQTNSSTASRSGSLTVAGQTFSLSQAGVPCTYTISPTSRTHTANAETGSVTVTPSNSACAWNATVTTAGTGANVAGSFTQVISVLENHMFEIATKTATPGNNTALPIGEVTSETTGGTTTITKTYTGVRFTGLNIPAGATLSSAKLTFKGSAAGVTKTVSIARSSDSSSFVEGNSNSNISLRATTGTALNWTIPATVAGTNYDSPDLTSLVSPLIGAGASDLAFVMVNAANTAVALSGFGSTRTSSYTAPTLTINWTLPPVGTSNAAWISISSGASGTGNGTVAYSVQTNSSTASRSGTLTIAGQTFSLSQSAALSGALSISPASHNFGSAPVLSSTTETQTLPRSGTRNTEYAPDRVIVKFRDSSTRDARRASRSRQSAGLIHELPLINAEVWQVTDVNALLAAQTRSADREIEYIEPDYIVSINATPNDSSLSQLWGLHNTGQTGGTADADIDAPEAWDIARGGSVVCGVIDTGVDYNHPDLAANMWRNPGEVPGNGVDDDRNGYVDDVYGYDFANNDGDPMDDHSHGTHVAGTIAGVGNNGIGITGVNWTGRVMALKFMDSSGRGYTSNAVRAVQYATQMGVKCTNSSWGGGYSQALYDAIKAAGNAGSLFMAAAGNDYGNNNDVSPVYPTSYSLDNIISVCASDSRDKLASFSNYGVSSVDLCAPGVGILSALPGNQYASYNGTSMATPHVAGAVALLWAAHPELSAAQVKAKLMASVDVKSNLAGSSVTGGRLNLFQSLTGIAQAQDFTVTNTGQAAVTLAQVTLAGQNPADFKIQQNTCSGSLNPAGTCKVTVSFAPSSAGAKQAMLTVSTTGGHSASASLSGNATAVSGAGSSVSAFSFAESSLYDAQTGLVYLPSVFVDGDTSQQYNVTLCPAGNVFTVCGASLQGATTATANQLGNTVLYPATGIAEIPVIGIQGMSSSGEAGVNPSAYSVKLQVVGAGLQVIELMPIW